MALQALKSTTTIKTKTLTAEQAGAQRVHVDYDPELTAGLPQEDMPMSALIALEGNTKIWMCPYATARKKGELPTLFDCKLVEVNVGEILVILFLRVLVRV